MASATHSIGGSRVKQIVFECRVGGRIYEELKDGRRFQWGKLTAWDPPRRVAFTGHPSREERDAQEVEVSFLPEGTGTRLLTLGLKVTGKLEASIDKAGGRIPANST